MRTNPLQTFPGHFCVLCLVILASTLALAAPPKITITRQLQSKTVFTGTTNSCRVTATGGSSLTCEWRLDGITLAGQTTNVQRATDLVLGDWITIQPEATSPVTVSVDRATSFYRVVGQ